MPNYTETRSPACMTGLDELCKDNQCTCGCHMPDPLDPGYIWERPDDE